MPRIGLARREPRGGIHGPVALGLYTQTIHRGRMGSRTISLSEDAYEALRSLKQPGESFSDVVRRLARRRSLLELAGAVDPEGAEAIAKAVEANRRERLGRRREELGLP